MKGLFDDIQESRESIRQMEEAYELFRDRRSLCKKGASYIRKRLWKEGIDLNEDLIRTVVRRFYYYEYPDYLESQNQRSKAKKKEYTKKSREKDKLEVQLARFRSGELDAEEFKELIDKEDSEEEPSYHRSHVPEPYEGGDKDNILVIGDTHEPFSQEGYLEHCREVQERFDCGTVVHIGDVIDNHFSSYHEIEPQGLGADDELDRAISRVKDWGYTFPEVRVCIGNHDRVVHRKAKTAGLSSKWIKDFHEVFGLDGWTFDESHMIHGVLFEHGNGRSGYKAALDKALHKRVSVVQGHIHTQGSVMYSESQWDRMFGMQVGCGIDENTYAMAYAQDFPKSFIRSCGVILNRGELPIVVPMRDDKR